MKFKKVFALIAALIFFHHLGCTILYLLPNNPMTSRYMKWVDGYMAPLFGQNWNLFAPEPATSGLNVVYRCRVGDQWSEWKDTLSSLTANHARTRFTPRGKILYIYHGIARDLLNSYVQEKNKTGCSEGYCLKEVENAVMKKDSYPLASRWIKDLCSWEKENFDGFQFQVLKVFPKQFSERKNPDASLRVERIEFSPVEAKS